MLVCVAACGLTTGLWLVLPEPSAAQIARAERILAEARVDAADEGLSLTARQMAEREAQIISDRLEPRRAQEAAQGVVLGVVLSAMGVLGLRRMLGPRGASGGGRRLTPAEIEEIDRAFTGMGR